KPADGGRLPHPGPPNLRNRLCAKGPSARGARAPGSARFPPAVATRRWILAGWAAASALTLLVLAASAPAGETAQLQVVGTPDLFPSFSPGVHTYVARCEQGKPLGLSFTAPSGVQVKVDGRKARGGSFSRSIHVGSGQSVRFATGEKRYL